MSNRAAARWGFPRVLSRQFVSKITNTECTSKKTSKKVSNDSKTKV